MLHLLKPPSQFKNLFWDFRVVGVAIFARELVQLLLYLLGGSRPLRITGLDPESTAATSLRHKPPRLTELAVFPSQPFQFRPSPSCHDAR
jgi:hypothetical protein